MLEIFIDTRGEFGIDNLGDIVADFPRLADRAAISALKSEGYRLKGVLQRALRTGGPDGAKWPELNPHTDIIRNAFSKRRNRSGPVKNYRMVWKTVDGKKVRVKEFWGQRGAKILRSPMLKLAAGVRYVFDPDTSAVSVGFVNPRVRLARYLGLQESGFESAVTPRKRRMLFALGFPVKASTKSLHIPARPLIGPVFVAERSAVFRNLEEKFRANLDNLVQGAA